MRSSSRLVRLFQDSKYSWSTLVRALVTSPITTLAADARTRQQNGEVICRVEAGPLLAALGARLGRGDACNLRRTRPGRRNDDPAHRGGPAFGRIRPRVGGANPARRIVALLSAGVENICENTAAEVVYTQPVPRGRRRCRPGQYHILNSRSRGSYQTPSLNTMPPVRTGPPRQLLAGPCSCSRCVLDKEVIDECRRPTIGMRRRRGQ